MPHDGFLQMAKPYISAFKAGAKTVDSYIESDQLIYWYRPTLKSASCDSTDTCEKPWTGSTPNANYFVGKPNGYDTMEDSIFVVALLKSAGTVTVISGSNSQTFNANAGPNAFEVAMGTGKQSFSLTRGGETVLSGDSLKDIISDCVCGLYNFNAYVGTLPAGPSDPLQSDGLKAFASGLSATCQATPSLGTASGAGTGSVAIPTSTGAASPSLTATSAAVSSSADSANSVAPVTSAPATSSPAQQSSVSPPANPITTAAAPPATTPVQQPTTTTAAAVAGGGSSTITALSQLYPTNCMQKGDVWAGPAGSDPAALCDG